MQALRLDIERFTQAPPLAEGRRWCLERPVFIVKSWHVEASDACRQRICNAAEKQRFIEALPMNELKPQNHRMPPPPVTSN